ncbi:MAG: hypothetical protein AABY22_18775 [Nanoarchaeota archaeon]
MAIRTCPLCKKEFKTLIKIDGKKYNLCNRKYCLECSPFKAHNTTSLEIKAKYEILADGEQLRECEHHGKSIYRDFGTDKTENWRCKKCVSYAPTKRRYKQKQKIVDMFGGACKICKYNKCLKALEFHHLEPEHKDFGISNFLHYSEEKLIQEASKCLLVCCRCHREIHDGLINL